MARTRTTGSQIFRSLEALKRAELNLAHPENPVHQRSNEIAEVATQCASVLDDPATRFFDSEGKVITFARKSLERIGGEGEGEYISEDGKFEVWGKDGSEYRHEFPLQLFVDGKEHSIASGSAGLMAYFRGSNASRTRALAGGKASVLQCLNGMETALALGEDVKRKQTGTLDIRTIFLQGLANLAKNYRGFGADIEAMQSRTVNQKEVAEFLLACTQLRYKSSPIISWSDCGKVWDIFNDTKSDWFVDDKPTVWRLYNSATRYAESQSSAEVRERVAKAVYYPLSTAGLYDLPTGHYSATFASLAGGWKQDNHATRNAEPVEPDPRQVEIEPEHYQVLSN